MANYVLSEGAARKLAVMLRGKSAEVGAVAERGAAVDDSGYPLPYTVRWSGTETDGGCWVIWLGDDDILYWNKHSVDLQSECTACNNLPDGWYSLNNVLTGSGSETLYLVIDESDPDNPTAELKNSEDSGSDKVSVLIASMSTNATTKEKIIWQGVSGTIVAGAGENGGEAVDRGPFKHSLSSSIITLTNCYLLFGRVLMYHQSDMTISAQAGILCVKVVHGHYDTSGGSGAGVLVPTAIDSLVYAAAPLNSSSNMGYTLIPLYVTDSAGAVTVDLRNIPTAVVRE